MENPEEPSNLPSAPESITPDPAQGAVNPLEYMPQVNRVARNIHSRINGAVELDDLVQAGVVGLLDALGRYDTTKNVKLSTYAEYRIRGAITDFLRQLDHIPRSIRTFGKDAAKATVQLEARLGRTPTEDETAQAMGVDLETYREHMQVLDRSKTLSLYAAPEDPDSPQLDIADRSAILPDEIYTKKQLQGILRALRGRLSEREGQILTLYYEKELTLKQIGEQLFNEKTGEPGVIEARVSQLHHNALRSLRRFLKEDPGLVESLQVTHDHKKEPSVVPEKITTKEEYRQAMEVLGGKVPKRYRQVLSFIYEDGLGYDQIGPQIFNEKSRKFGVTTGRAWQLHHEALDYVNTLLHAPEPQPADPVRDAQKILELLKATVAAKQHFPEFIASVMKEFGFSSPIEFERMTNERLRNLGEEEFGPSNFYYWSIGQPPRGPFLHKFARAWNLENEHMPLLWQLRSAQYDVDIEKVLEQAEATTPPRRDLLVQALIARSGYVPWTIGQEHSINSENWIRNNCLVSAEAAKRLLVATNPLHGCDEAERPAREKLNGRILKLLTGQALDKSLTELCEDPKTLFLELRKRAGLTVPEAARLLGAETRTVSMFGRGELHVNEAQARNLLGTLADGPKDAAEEELLIEALTCVPHVSVLIQRVREGTLNSGQMVAMMRSRRGAELGLLLPSPNGHKISGGKQHTARKKIRDLEERNFPLTTEEAEIVANKLGVPEGLKESFMQLTSTCRAAKNISLAERLETERNAAASATTGLS